MKPKRKLPIASGTGGPDVELSAADWRRIERELNGPDAAHYAKRLIRSNFHDAGVPESSDKIKFIVGVLTSLLVACHEANDELKNTTSGYRDGLWWEEWIRRLTTIVHASGLPGGARNDRDKQKGNKPSPFVAFVQVLQNCAPSEFRRSTQSADALSKAINRARDPNARA